jgi:phosphotransferase family enzyme
MIEERVEALLGSPVARLGRIEGRGYSVAFRAVAELEDGRTAFVKAGTEPVTSGFLREEIRFYRAVQEPFMPALLGFDQNEPPIVVLEDLSGGRWPPPWDATSIDAVRETLAAVAATPAPAGLSAIEERRDWLCGGWAEIEREPHRFLSLGVIPDGSLDAALPALRAAAESAPIEGGALIHLDVRSDNVCLTERGAVLVDWNHACRANPDLDVACWLPSLRLEGGPAPQELLPAAGGFAALLAGFFGSRAGLPAPETAPDVRRIQLGQLRASLDWAALELGLDL